MLVHSRTWDRALHGWSFVPRLHLLQAVIFKDVIRPRKWLGLNRIMGDLLWHCFIWQGKCSVHHLHQWHGARKGLGFFRWYLRERQSFTPFQASRLYVDTGCADRRQLLLAQQVMQPRPNTGRKDLN